MMNGIEGNTPMKNQGGNVVCFYHEYEENGCFSNWYPASFEYAGQHYNCVEQYMMYQKVLMFRQYDLAEKISMKRSEYDEFSVSKCVCCFYE